jgi:hypothetical protein
VRKALFLVWALAMVTAGQATAPNKLVSIFFYHQGQETHANPLGLGSVKRRVPASAPAKPALLALLGGPNSTERSRGYFPLDSAGLSVQKLINKKGTWHLYFVSHGPKTWPGDLSPARFHQAVEKTMLQFPTVRRVVVYVNGRTDFASGR